MSELLTFACPRCQTDVEEHYYGPCAACVVELHELFPRNPHYVDEKGKWHDLAAGEAAPETEYVPKMNVTPNQIASKD